MSRPDGVLGDVGARWPSSRKEEIFGAVLALIADRLLRGAIEVAQRRAIRACLPPSRRQNFDYIQRFPSDIEAGTVKVNRTTTGNLVNAPFGGVKGLLHRGPSARAGARGLDFFTQIKTVYTRPLRPRSKGRNP